MTAGSPPKPPQRLGVLVDGAPLADGEAYALWERFSAWMEGHHGDLAGFAAQEGYASVHPGVDGDRPILRASRTVAQAQYAAVRPAGGSPTGQAGTPPPGRTRGGAPDPSRKRGR